MRIWASPLALLASSFFVIGLLVALPPTLAQSEGKFVIKPVAEKRLSQLPQAPLVLADRNLPDAGSSRGSCAANFSGGPSRREGLALHARCSRRLNIWRHQSRRNRPCAAAARGPVISATHQQCQWATRSQDGHTHAPGF